MAAEQGNKKWFLRMNGAQRALISCLCLRGRARPVHHQLHEYQQNLRGLFIFIFLFFLLFILRDGLCRLDLEKARAES